MSIVTESAITIATALAEYPDLPYVSMSVWNDDTAYINAGLGGGRGFTSVSKVAVWAREFSTELIISLSSYGNGAVETTVELGGKPVSVKTSIGTQQAYELGRLLRRELNVDVSIHVGADELLAAIDQVVA